MAYKPKYKRSPPRGLWVFDVVGAVFLLMLLLGGGMFLKERLQSRADQQAFQELEVMVKTQTLPPAEIPGPTQGQEPEVPATEEPVSPYQILKDQNPDFAAWLTVPGTLISYPVMYTPQDREYYIHRAFDGSDSPSGTPFVGEYGSLDEQSCVIYGHNMKDGTMFHELLSYENQAFWQDNPRFTVATLTETREYEIFAAVRIRLLAQNEPGLRYYRLEKGTAAWLTEHSLYDTGIHVAEGEEFVILSTCTYHTDEGRFVIAGKRIR